MLFALLCLCLCSIPSYNYSNCCASHITQLNPPKKIQQMLKPLQDRTGNCRSHHSPGTAATTPPGRKKIKRSNLFSKRSSTGFLGFPPRQCQKGVFTFGLAGPSLYIIVLYLFMIFPHISTCFYVFPNVSKLSRCLCRISMAWRCLTHHLLATLSNQNLSPQKNDGLQWVFNESSMCIIIFQYVSSFSQLKVYRLWMAMGLCPDIWATWVSEKYRLFCRHEVWNLGLGWQGGNGQEQY